LAALMESGQANPDAAVIADDIMAQLLGGPQGAMPVEGEVML